MVVVVWCLGLPLFLLRLLSLRFFFLSPFTLTLHIPLPYPNAHRVSASVITHALAASLVASPVRHVLHCPSRLNTPIVTSCFRRGYWGGVVLGRQVWVVWSLDMPAGENLDAVVTPLLFLSPIEPAHITLHRQQLFCFFLLLRILMLGFLLWW